MRQCQTVLIATCSILMLGTFARADEYKCDDVKVLSRLKDALACGVQCVPGLTNEEVAQKSEADLSNYIEGILSEGRPEHASLTRYMASVFARGMIDGLTNVIGITTRVRRYDPVTHQYECEADLEFDTAKLTSFEKFYKLKLLLAPTTGAPPSVEAQKAIVASRTDPAPLDAYLSSEVATLMASGFQSAMSKVRYTVRGLESGELLLTLDPDFTESRIRSRMSSP
jgi:hypothetical protein